MVGEEIMTLKDFFIESIEIEGYNPTKPMIDDMVMAYRILLDVDVISEEVLEKAQRKMLEHQHDKPKTYGYRDCRVRVGNHVPPSPHLIDYLMRDWLKKYYSFFPQDTSAACDLHTEFETIHPFEDGNGRMGRLLWLVGLGYNDLDKEVPWFLRTMYYYLLSNRGKK